LIRGRGIKLTTKGSVAVKGDIAVLITSEEPNPITELIRLRADDALIVNAVVQDQVYLFVILL
jgi:hypothetical protein